MTEETEQSNIWKYWAIEDSLKKTDTYDILYNNSANIEFECEKDLCNFIKYCEYMMFSNSDYPQPVPEEECREYFRRLYKYVDSIYTDIILEKKYN